MKKILVLSSFPAPYRIDVFSGLSQNYTLDIFFGTDKDQNRSKSYFASKKTLHYYVIDNPEGKKYFIECVSDLTQYDLVLAYDWYLRYALKIEQKCIRHKIPYVINCDGAFIQKGRSFNSFLKKAIKSYYVKHAALCLAGGTSAEEYFKYYGAKNANITRHNFSSLHADDILTKPISEKEKIERRKKLGLKDSKAVMAVGQFIERKGFDVLINAWTDLDEHYQLLLIGGGKEREKYEALIKKYRYQNIKILDFLSKKELVEFYRAANVFAMPTREDIWGLVINEAMAAGLPVISTNKCNAAVELVDDNLTGKIIDVDDNEALHDAMYSMLQLDDKEIEIMGQKVLEVASAYTIEEIVARHILNFKTVLHI